MGKSVVSSIYRECLPRTQTRGSRFVRTRTPATEIKDTFAVDKVFHDELLGIPVGMTVNRAIDFEAIGAYLKEIYHINKSRQGEFMLGKVTSSSIAIFRSK